MLCIDLQVPTAAPEKAVMKAWNLMVGHALRYIASFQQIARMGEDELLRYRAGEMAMLLQERDRIRAFDYELSVKVLRNIHGGSK